MNPSVRQAIAAIPEDGVDHDQVSESDLGRHEQRWISEAQVAETTFTAFTSHPQETAGALPTSGAPGPTAQPVGEAGTGRAVRDVASPRVRHQLHPVRGRGGRDAPRPRDHRTGHRRAEGRPAGARPVREITVHRREQEGAKAASVLFDSIEPLLFQKPRKKFLRQILGVLRPIASPPDVGVERVPICLAELRERRRLPRRIRMVRVQHNAPVRRCKPLSLPSDSDMLAL